VVPSSAKLAATGEVQRSHGDLLSETMPVVTHPGYSKQDTGGGCVRELMKEGFTRDLLVVIALTVLLGASVTSGVAYAVNAYLARQVTGVLGDLGEYDLILHARFASASGSPSAHSDKLTKNIVVPDYERRLLPVILEILRLNTYHRPR
jgi:hypothetical protein